jgi:steroid delta-isomerase-like uncharacterized protein
MIDQVLAPDWEAIPALPSGGRGATGFRELAGFLRGVFPDLTVTVEDIVAAGDRVAVRATARGTHSADLIGVPATGRAVEYRAFEIHRLEDGRIAQTWHVQDYRCFVPPRPTAPLRERALSPTSHRGA